MFLVSAGKDSKNDKWIDWQMVKW